MHGKTFLGVISQESVNNAISRGFDRIGNVVVVYNFKEYSKL